jgi:hypothetical protein
MRLATAHQACVLYRHQIQITAAFAGGSSGQMPWNTSAHVKQPDVGLELPNRNLLQLTVIAAVNAGRMIWMKYSGAH